MTEKKENVYTKQCPVCRGEMSYTRNTSLTKSIKENLNCRECYYKSRICKGPFKKNCPDCGKIINYVYHYNLMTSIKENWKCKSCCKKLNCTLEEIRDKEKIYNKEYNKRQETKEKRKKYYRIHKDEPRTKQKKKETDKNYRNKPESKKKMREYRKEYDKKPEVIEKRKNGIYKLNRNISCAIWRYLKFNNISKNRRHWEDIVGYTVQELKEHIEKLFQPGMTWENKGDWHLDHRIPLSFFQYTSTDDVEFRYCWSLNNLQPLWAEENIEKADKILKKYIQKPSNL